MKKSLLSLLFLLYFFPSAVFTQYLSSFGNDTTSWVETYCNLDQFHEDSYFVYKDTVLNGLAYKIACFRDPIAGDICSSAQVNFNSNGYIREDTSSGKMWYYSWGTDGNGNQDTLERLIADLSLSVGDTFRVWDHGWWRYEDKLVDSVWTVNGLKRVRVDFSPGTALSPKLTFIEGAGLNYSPAYQHTTYNLCMCLTEWKKDGQLAFSQNCEVMGSVNDAEASAPAKVYPHPVEALSKISFENPSFRRASLKIFDIHGRQILHRIDRIDHFELNADALPGGVLFYQIEIEEGKLFRGKLLVK